MQNFYFQFQQNPTDSPSILPIQINTQQYNYPGISHLLVEPATSTKTEPSAVSLVADTQPNAATTFAICNGNDITEYEIKLVKVKASHAYSKTLILKRNSQATVLKKHPTMPMYVSGGKDGVVRLWSWRERKQLAVYDQVDARKTSKNFEIPLENSKTHENSKKSENSEILSITFDTRGTKLAIGDARGFLSLYRVASGMANSPILCMKLGKKPLKIEFQHGTSSLLYITHSDCSIHLFDMLQGGARIGYWRLPEPCNLLTPFRLVSSQTGIYSLDNLTSLTKLAECVDSKSSEKKKPSISVISQYSEGLLWLNHDQSLHKVLIDPKNGKFDKSSGVCKKLPVIGRNKPGSPSKIDSFSPIANKSVINSGQAAAYANMKHNTSIGSEPANLASGAEISPCLVELVNGQFMAAGSNGSVWLVEDFFGHK